MREILFLYRFNVRLFPINRRKPCLQRSVATRSKAWVCSRSLAGIVGSNPAWDMGLSLSFSLLSVVCCQVEVGHCVGLITRPEEFYQMSCVWVWSWIVDNRTWPTRGCRAIQKLDYLLLHIAYYVVINLFRVQSCDRSVAFSLLTLSCVSSIARSSSTLFATVPKLLQCFLRPSTGP